MSDVAEIRTFSGHIPRAPEQALEVLRLAKSAFEQGFVNGPPLHHVMADVPHHDQQSIPWDALCHPYPLWRALQPLTKDPESYATLRGAYCGPGTSEAILPVFQRFIVLAAVTIPALADSGLRTFDSPGHGYNLGDDGLCQALWLGELYRIAWEGCHPLLKAPRYRLHKKKENPAALVKHHYDPEAEAVAESMGPSPQMPPGLTEEMYGRVMSATWKRDHSGELAFPHRFFSVLCDGKFDVFQASAWALETILASAENAALASVETPSGKTKPGTAKKIKRRRTRQPRVVPLTPNQTEAAYLVGEHKGDVTAAARAAGKSRQAMDKLYKKALKKLGQSANRAKKPKTQALPEDSRGQVKVAAPDRE
jgi:hypothetical protein